MGRLEFDLLKELARSYDSLVSDTSREMNQVKAIYRGRAIGCAGRDVYYQRNREQRLEKLTEFARHEYRLLSQSEPYESN